MICSSAMSGVFGIAPNSGWNGSRGWKSSGPFFTCTITLSRNRPSSGTNSSVRALDAVGIDVLVVDERAPHHDAAVRRQRVGQHVGAVGVRAAVVLRAGLAFAVGLDDEAAEVGNQPVDLVRLRLSTTAPPPGRADRRSAGRRAASARRSSPRGRRGCRTAAARRRAPRPSSRYGASSDSGFALTLLITVPLMPIDAFARA